ncbi:Glutathione S-transferase L1 [Symbiodinium microadriaticum]|uniref:Glutathione S-transferase L1 n=1 Tax=Symbiodinium microadriaticum TaxID=2951 RepID=A0A1Q9DPR1_SYMMI|nr:Glutathione S-transferase L1 [Symbiodinium microadriaticum]
MPLRAGRLCACSLLAVLVCRCDWRCRELFVSGRLRVDSARRGWMARCAEATSWADLEERLPSAVAQEPLLIDSVLQPDKPDLKGLTLFRERNGWCPYSERVWLALEAKGLDYSTVLVDNYGRRASWLGGQTPQILWADGRRQGESLDIIKALDTEYPDTHPLWPDNEVTELVNAFKSTFPKQTRPSSRAAFLFSWNGPIFRSEFEATLSKTDGLLARHPGPFFRGEKISAADCAWAPFLERYAAQLPCLHRGLRPYDRSRWPKLAAWYEAATGDWAAYAQEKPFVANSPHEEAAARIVRNRYGNAGVPPHLVAKDDSSHPQAATGDWAAYAQEKPFVANSPHEEAAARIVRNREALAKDAVASGIVTEKQVDEGLRGVAALLSAGASPSKEDVSDAVVAVAKYLDSRMCVPRDMGFLPGKAIRSLAASLSGSGFELPALSAVRCKKVLRIGVRVILGNQLTREEWRTAALSKLVYLRQETNAEFGTTITASGSVVDGEANRAALKSVAEVDEAGVATVKALQVLFEDYKAEVEPAPHMFHVLEMLDRQEVSTEEVKDHWLYQWLLRYGLLSGGLVAELVWLGLGLLLKVFSEVPAGGTQTKPWRLRHQQALRSSEGVELPAFNQDPVKVAVELVPLEHMIVANEALSEHDYEDTLDSWCS